MAVNIRRKTKAQEEMGMATISDIVFLLLVYFMVVTVFQQDMGLPFVLPAATEDSATVAVKQSNVADLVVNEASTVYLDDVPIRINAIKNELEKRLGANPKLVVILSTHPQADYGTMVAVLDEVRLAKCRNMAIKMLEV